MGVDGVLLQQYHLCFVELTSPEAFESVVLKLGGAYNLR